MSQVTKTFKNSENSPKIVKNCQNCQNCQKLSKLSKIVKIVKNCQNCQKLSKIVKTCQNCKIHQKLSKIVKIVKNCQKKFKIVKKFQNCQICQKIVKIVKMLVRSCFLITVIKYLKGHWSLGSLFNVPGFPFIGSSYNDKMRTYNQTELHENQMQDHATWLTTITFIDMCNLYAIEGNSRYESSAHSAEPSAQVGHGKGLPLPPPPLVQCHRLLPPLCRRPCTRPKL